MAQQRQLVAIMFTDIVGYTALMQRDENQAISIRTRHRESFESSTKKYNGRILQYFGDGTLSIFTSTVEAVECAIELQREWLSEPKIPVRIGIHVGDVMYSDDDIIGDAVNVASRIESGAIGGSILISDKVHDQIRSHTHIESKFIDVVEFKNIDGAMPLFAITNEGLNVPQKEEVKTRLKGKNLEKKSKFTIKKIAAAFLLLMLAILLSNKFGFFTSKATIFDKSIAVLPFDNLSTDDDSEIFRDGITEDILTQLSKIKELKVISRTSVMQYKGTEKTIPKIAKELGVTYILEGSIRKYGDDIRVTAQLIDAANDEHMWGENYDKTLTNIFAIQTEVSQEIVAALELNLSFEEQQSIAIVPVYDIEAYKYFLKGRQEADKKSLESIVKSIELYKEALAIDSNYAEAYAEIANSIYLQTYYGTIDIAEAAKQAREYVDKAEAINNKISRIYSVRGLIYNIEGRTDLAKAEFQKALALSPNDLTARYQYANLHYYTKEYDKQLEQAEIAYRLDPLSFATANTYFTALLTNKKYDEAEELIKKIEADGIENNQLVIHRSYIRLYMDKRDFKKGVFHLEKVVDEMTIFNRFLGYSYAKIGDTLGAYRMLKHIRANTPPEFLSHQLSVVYAGLQKTDSALYYLDPVRNKQIGLIMRDRGTFFTELEDNPDFQKLMKAQGLSGTSE
jgi:TolB-like protein/class 3 adenylate cyclase/Tfp pilus assembly protein PilF